MCVICNATASFDPARHSAGVPAEAALREGTTDAAASIATIYSMQVGDTFSGSLGGADTTDWIAINLVAGETYTIELQGTDPGGIADPYLKLFDDTGRFLALDDDSGPGRDSALVFQANYTGTYYISAEEYFFGAGRYQVSVTQDGSVSGLVETADAASGPSTAYSMSVGDTFSGTIEIGDAADWVAIRLTAGQSYQIALSGQGAGTGTLSDPLVRIYDVSGTQIASNDDDGPGNDSLLTFTASTTGTYYVAADAYADATGTYQLSVTPDSSSDDLPRTGTLDELATYLTDDYWELSFDNRRAWSDDTITVNITALTTEGRQLARWALEAWEMVADITFIETTGTADITFDDDDSGAYASSITSGGALVSVDVNVSRGWLDRYGTTLDSYSFSTYVHEVGHALGLGHQGPYNGGIIYPDDAAFANDSYQLSVMSYFSQTENPNVNASYAEPVTAMMADIVAVHDLYGAPGPDSPTAGNTIWGEGSTLGTYLDDLFAGRNIGRDPVALTIYDVDGIDRIMLGSQIQGMRFDLNAESFSDVGGLTGNFAIARGTVIEHLTAGSGDDTITGNAANNHIILGSGDDYATGDRGRDRLKGNGGEDTLEGGGGRDRLIGGGGADVIDGGEGHDRLKGGGGADTLDGGAGDDRLVGKRGADTFVFSSGDDTVKDFRNSDRINLSDAQGIDNFADLTANHAVQDGDAVIITDDDGDTLTLQDISLASLAADDFLF
jgi:serralysin